MDSPVILITGAGKGIGKATAQEILARAGTQRPRLLLTSRTESDLTALQRLCMAANIECEILPLELYSDPSKPVTLAIQKWGRLDTVIHSAGVGRFGDFLDLTLEDLEFVYQTNIAASFKLMQEAYREMKKQKSGTLVWITSVAAEKPFEQSAIYCMSKYAQRGLIEVMRLSGYKDGIRILDVKPGATITPMWGADLTEEMKTKMITAEDVAKIMLDAIQLPLRASVEEITIRPLKGDL